MLELCFGGAFVLWYVSRTMLGAGLERGSGRRGTAECQSRTRSEVCDASKQRRAPAFVCAQSVKLREKCLGFMLLAVRLCRVRGGVGGLVVVLATALWS